MPPTSLVGTTPVFINLDDHNEAKLNTAAITEENLIYNNNVLLSRIGARRKVNSLIALMC